MKLENIFSEDVSLEDIKDRKEAEIWDYDRSEEINKAFINGKEVWYSKEERQSLKMRFEAERDCGKKMTTLWYGNNSFSMGLPDAFQFLSRLENYAAECFDNTKRHIAEMRELDKDLLIYDYKYKTGYPEKIDFIYA